MFIVSKKIKRRTDKDKVGLVVPFGLLPLLPAVGSMINKNGWRLDNGGSDIIIRVLPHNFPCSRWGFKSHFKMQ